MIAPSQWEAAARAAGLLIRSREPHWALRCTREVHPKGRGRAILRVQEEWARVPGCNACAEHPTFREFRAEAWLDTEGRLHREDGPAVVAADGQVCWFLHGTHVEPRVVTHPERITVGHIRTARDAEVRRILRERYGTLRFLSDIGARVVDEDTVPVDRAVPDGARLVRALLEDDQQDRYLVASDGSTSRVYVMRVPSDTTTCRAAYDALSGRAGARTILEA